MYIVCVTFSIHANKLTSFLPLMSKQAKNSLKQEPGCLVFDVCQGENAASEVFLYEVYENRAAFDVHLETAHFKQFDDDVRDMVAEKSVRTYTRL